MLNHLTKHKLPYNLVMIAIAHEPAVNLCLLLFLRQLLVFPFLCCKRLNHPRLFPMAEHWAALLAPLLSTDLLEHLRMLLPKACGTDFFLHTWVLHTLKGQIKTPDAVNNSPHQSWKAKEEPQQTCPRGEEHSACWVPVLLPSSFPGA